MHFVLGLMILVLLPFSCFLSEDRIKRESPHIIMVPAADWEESSQWFQMTEKASLCFAEGHYAEARLLWDNLLATIPQKAEAFRSYLNYNIANTWAEEKLWLKALHYYRSALYNPQSTLSMRRNYQLAWMKFISEMEAMQSSKKPSPASDESSSDTNFDDLFPEKDLRMLDREKAEKPQYPHAW